MQVANFGRVVLWVVAAVLLFMAAFFGLNRLRDDSVVLQSYAVPPEIGEEVANALAGALWRGDSAPPIGQVRRLPNGRLLVTAPASVQNSVGRIIDDIIKNKPGPTPSIGFEMWVVTAGPAEGAQGNEGLAEVSSALEVIRKAKGPMRFELLEKIQTTAKAGEGNSQVSGARARMQVKASVRTAEDGKAVVAADLQLGVSGFAWESSLRAQSEMHSGELLVVGQSALGSQPGTPPTNKQLYYIVRATL